MSHVRFNRYAIKKPGTRCALPVLELALAAKFLTLGTFRRARIRFDHGITLDLLLSARRTRLSYKLKQSGQLG